MHIREARPAPRHILIPAPALEALLSAKHIGKGHLATVLKMARYLWGDVSLEGTAADFAEVLGVDERTIRRHVPEVGQTGCWHCTQPHHGIYAIWGFARTPEDVAAIRALWEEARAAGCRSFLEVSRYWKWTKLSIPVVVPSFRGRETISTPPTDGEQQHAVSPDGEGGVGGGGAKRTKLSISRTKLSESPVAADLAGLVGDETAIRLLAEYGRERVERQLAHYRWARRQGKANGPGWLIRAIEADWALPPEVERRFWGSERYLEGAFGETVEW